MMPAPRKERRPNIFFSEKPSADERSCAHARREMFIVGQVGSLQIGRRHLNRSSGFA
jgi:hypothetical protein